MKVDELEQILKILKQNDVREFEFEHGGVHIKLARGAAGSIAPVNLSQPLVSHVEIEPAVSGHSHKSSQASKATTEEDDFAHLFKVESPIVGTFYRKANPESESFVTEGKVVKKGDTLCIIEAMKLMNEIEAPIAGKIEKINLQDGQVAEFGEILFYINPNI